VVEQGRTGPRGDCVAAEFCVLHPRTQATVPHYPCPRGFEALLHVQVLDSTVAVAGPLLGSKDSCLVQAWLAEALGQIAGVAPRITHALYFFPLALWPCLACFSTPEVEVPTTPSVSSQNI
jgi:hypothetical protein